MDMLISGIAMSGSTSGGAVLLLLVIIVIAVVVLYWIASTVITNSNTVATPGNIQSNNTSQEVILANRWIGISQRRTGLVNVDRGIPADQRLLINVAALGARYLGYLGPFNSGTFNEDAATRIALSSGARCLVIEVDKLQGGVDPVLIYRDGWGQKQSLNMGSIQRVATSIAARAFTPANDSVPPALSEDPLIVVVYFHSTPNAVEAPKDYIRFLGKVAQSLQPLTGLLVAQTPQGDFRRQAQESQLFFTPYSVFQRRIIMLTNADTTPFRRLSPLGMTGEITPAQDLDLMVHARLYTPVAGLNLGVSSTPTTSVTPAAIITTPDYWLQTPPDRFADAQTQTKRAWTLVMQPIATASNTPTADQLKKLYNSFGVHCVPLCIFDSATVTDGWTGTGQIFSRAAWAVKPELLRFIPPQPINVLRQVPQANARGGALIAPK
jgi:hypothetical protein